MKKEVILLLFIVVFAGVVYLLITSSEASLTKNMSARKTVEPTSGVLPAKNGAKEDKQMTAAPTMIIDVNKTYTATLKTNMGDIELALDVKGTPKTVNNFVYLARKDFYDNTVFHRVIKDFMIQGGDPEGTGMGGPGYKFEDEITAKQAFDKPGILAMANSGPNTNGSQFFITQVETPWLSGHHTIFGYVTKGMDVVNAIEATPTGQNDKPIKDVVVTDVVISEK